MTRKERALRNLKQMCSDGRYLGSGSHAPLEVLEDFNLAIKALDQEPTTKNDLGVDCISRTLVQSAISRSIEYKENPHQLYKRIESLPSVTPIRPKGHWIDTNNHHYYNDGDIETTELRCSCCNKEVEWDIELLHKPYYCENCGAKMESEVEE
jgi:hypothetical protein